MSNTGILGRHHWGDEQVKKRTFVPVIVLIAVVLLLGIALRVVGSGQATSPDSVPGWGVCPAAGGAMDEVGVRAGRFMLSAVAAITDTEWLVLQQVAGDLGCAGDIWLQETQYTLACAVAAGHSVTARIERFPGVLEARAAFDAARGGRPEQRFRCYPSCSWQYDESPIGLVMRHRIQTWLAGRWLLYVEAFDDTGYLIAPAPAHVAELVDRAAAQHWLFGDQACRTIYLAYGALP